MGPSKWFEWSPSPPEPSSLLIVYHAISMTCFLGGDSIILRDRELVYFRKYTLGVKRSPSRREHPQPEAFLSFCCLFVYFSVCPCLLRHVYFVCRVLAFKNLPLHRFLESFSTPNSMSRCLECHH